MLDPRIRAEIEAHAARYPARRAASLDALRLVQERERWVSDEHLRQIADLLGVSVHELEGVATFYNLVFRRPVGEHVILACDSVSCWMTGCDAVIVALRDRLGCELGGTSPDGRFTLLPMCCLGQCERAPVVMIDDDVHGDLRPADIEPLLARYR